jgi:3-phosphoshikimate 1-carboxyvinyltransferase
LELPGDKSISHRGAIIAALARGRSTLLNYSTGEDCRRTLEALISLGVPVERDGSRVCVTGRGPEGFRAPDAWIDCGNSGSTMRMLAGVLAGQAFASTLSGDDSLRSRPMRRVIEPLELMGARISADDGRAPLHIRGRRPLMPVAYTMPVLSAQVKACVLLAGLSARGRTEVVEHGGRTRDHTERMLRWFGVPVETTRRGGDGDKETPDDEDETLDDHEETLSEALAVEGPASFEARDLSIPGDISSAVFFIAAAALLPGSELEIADVGLNPTRCQILRTLRELGAAIEIEEAREECNEPLGTVRVKGMAGLGATAATASAAAARSNLILRGSLIAQLIDELPLLAVVGTQVEGGLTIRDAAELRVKESDRIAAVVWNLRAMGAQVSEHEDGLTVNGPCRLRGAKLSAFGDHRIAMAFSIAALLAQGETVIEGGASSVGVSFPEFYSKLESVVER